MSGLEVVALAVVAAWIAILTVLVLVTIRQVGILTLQLGSNGAATTTIGDGRVPADGLPIGTKIPGEVQRAIPESAMHPSFLVLVSATCNPCRELADEFNKQGFDRDESVVVLLTGEENLAAPLAALMPSKVRVIRDPQATTLARSLQLQLVPSALAIEAGRVTGRAYLRRLSDLFELLDGYEGMGGLEAAEPDGRGRMAQVG